ncbi:hypothetical protein AVEN_100249-1 [Araneus ventricosus]|uniref:Uncharacterized protein n=1 Tax=Araneus ventricosus TaxID=182803 RepID=A0A4Y2LHF7_ARAVE|nr:hypothetical protein AVEN_100249-1 [Araneus ventricosus]
MQTSPSHPTRSRPRFPTAPLAFRPFVMTPSKHLPDPPNSQCRLKRSPANPSLFRDCPPILYKRLAAFQTHKIDFGSRGTTQWRARGAPRGGGTDMEKFCS